MTLEEFKKLSGPAGLSAPLEALWWEARGEWERAHARCQEAGNRAGDWVHGYLHRKEGDEGNARYWYGRAGKRMPTGKWEEEWVELVETLLEVGEEML